MILFVSLALATDLPAGALLPDIVEGVPAHLNIQNKQKQEILRFTTEHINIGDGALQVRSNSDIGPCTVDGESYDQCTEAVQEVLDADGNVVYTQISGYAVFHPDHNHWHQTGVADFILYAGSGTDGAVVAEASKTTYCLIDYDKTDLVHANNTRVYFDCNAELQGISVGWSDEYHHSTHGQSLDITGLAVGTYTLEFVADPLDHWLELDESNNTSWSTFKLTRKGANPELTVIAESECEEGLTCGSPGNK